MMNHKYSQCMVGFGLLWLCASFALAQTTNARRTGSITGRIVTEDGVPASGAQVFYTELGSSRPSPPRNVPAADAEGNFTINNLEARSYRVSASLPGYVTANEDDANRAARLGDYLTLQLVKGGVITGRVLSPRGEPVIGTTIFPYRVRDGAGKATISTSGGRAALSDDRGVYRIYGLFAGAYVVATGPATSFPGSPFLGVAPVFHPANTRDGATEVVVPAGSEVSGIDIRYRYDYGHTVSGKVSGAVTAEGARGSILIRLTPPGSQIMLANASVDPSRGQTGFELTGIADGDYEISALRFDRERGSAWSAPRRVTVRQANVSGLELGLSPMAVITGKVVVEPLAAPNAETCGKSRQAALPATLNEILLTAQIVTKMNSSNSSLPPGFVANMVALAEDGTFSITSLEAGGYRLLTDLPGETWYVKSLALPASKTANAGAFTLSAGEKLSVVVVTVAEGAAQIRGKWSGKANSATGGKQRVHLVPADAAVASDVSRYYEAPIQSDGTFALTHLAPGKYWLIVKVAQPLGEGERLVRPLAWDATARAALRKEAEASAQSVELGACMRLSDYKLK